MADGMQCGGDKGFSIKEAAIRLKVCTKTLRNHVKRGSHEIEGHVVGYRKTRGLHGDEYRFWIEADAGNATSYHPHLNGNAPSYIPVYPPCALEQFREAVKVMEYAINQINSVIGLSNATGKTTESRMVHGANVAMESKNDDDG